MFVLYFLFEKYMLTKKFLRKEANKLCLIGQSVWIIDKTVKFTYGMSDSKRYQYKLSLIYERMRYPLEPIFKISNYPIRILDKSD